MARLKQEYSIQPYVYTTGRWLRRANQELDARYIKFDFDLLCKRVIRLCPNASSIVSYDKREGGFNRAFIFVLDNGKRLVAKLPFSIAGPPRFTTNSEVATIKFLQFNTSIPVPSILEWNDDPTNPVGSEYIIMDYVNGVQLHQVWSLMSREEQVRLVDSFCRVVKEMVGIDFPAYGSLYMQDDSTSDTNLIPLGNGVCIGPHCGTMFWDCNVGESRFYEKIAPNRGPWRDLASYCDALVDTGISRIPPTDVNTEDLPSYQGSPSAHLELLKQARSVIKQIAKDRRVKDAAIPILLHPDLHKRNIFVAENDHSRITGLIDWQSTSVEPAFWHSDETPDFAQEYRSDDCGDGICAKALDIGLQYYLPQLSLPRSMDEAFFRPFRYCYRTWKDGAVALEHELIETAQDWKTLQLPEPCPFTLPTSNERSIHQKSYRKFEAAQNLRRDLANLIDVATDGWVPSDEVERAEAAQREMYKGMLEAVLTNEDLDPNEPIRTEADLREIWPFDLSLPT